MKHYLKNLSVKDKILLIGTFLILIAIGALLLYNSAQPISLPQEDRAAEGQLHESSDSTPPENPTN